MTVTINGNEDYIAERIVTEYVTHLSPNGQYLVLEKEIETGTKRTFIFWGSIRSLEITE